MCLAVEDDGVGFDPMQTYGPEHQGLTNLRERAELLGGTLLIERRPEGGDTRARVRPRRERLGRVTDEGAPSTSSTGATGPARLLRLLIVDDHEIVRQGLVALLDRREGFAVVAEAGTVAEAIEQARATPSGHRRDGRPPARWVRHRSLPRDPRGDARDQGRDADVVPGRGGRPVRDRRRASGYLLKQIRARDLVAALEAVGRGESLLDPAVTEKVLERIRRIATGTYTDELAALTPQEQKILLLVAEGKTNKEIAADVFLSDKTVKNYVSSILAKLNLERRAQAAAFVANRRTGGVPPS